MGQCSLARGSKSLLVSFECYSLTLLLVPSASCLQLVIGFFFLLVPTVMPACYHGFPINMNFYSA